VERALLELLTLHRPDDAVLSEEAGALGAGRRRWLLDPIDGTEGFRAGGPVWDNHIALEVDGQLTVGIDTRPTQGRALVGVHGQGAYRSVHMRQAAIRAIRAATASVPVPIRTTTPKSSRSSHITHRPPAATSTARHAANTVLGHALKSKSLSISRPRTPRHKLRPARRSEPST
jgi:fructose-1,6-bisphosphatase/inositol monophosphatase family enzyme